MHNTEKARMTNHGADNARDVGSRLFRVRVRIENVNRTVREIAAALSAANCDEGGYAALLLRSASDLARIAGQIEAQRANLQERTLENCERTGVPALLADQDILYSSKGAGVKRPIPSPLAPDDDWDGPDQYEP